MRHVFRAIWIITAVFVFSTGLVAQIPPINTRLVGHFDEPGNSYADVWGEGNLAFLAHFGDGLVDIVDITDPTAPFRLSRYDAGGGGFFGPSAQEVKTGAGLMFVGLESFFGDGGVHIVDIRDPANPTLLTEVTTLPSVHNLFYADGWLYIADGLTRRIEFIDLRSYDPDNPPAVISKPTGSISTQGAFVHDVTVQNGRLYAPTWTQIEVWDVSGLPAIPPVLLGSAPGDSVHASWATDDGTFLVVGEERTAGGLTLYAVEDLGGAVNLTKLDEVVAPTNQTLTAHNPVIEGDTVYASWYGAGVVVLDIDRLAGRLRPRALFDTTVEQGGSFTGCWGVYPFLGPDKVLASDMSNGLFVIQVNSP